MASNYQRQTSSHSSGDTITAAHLDDEFDYLYATVLNGGASTGIGTNDLMNDAVNGTKIADDAIDSEHYVDGSIDTAHLANDAVDADKLASNAVVDASIAKTGAFSLFGTKVTTDSDSAALAAYNTSDTAVVYKTETDGIVEVRYTHASTDSNIIGYAHSTSTFTSSHIIGYATTGSINNPKYVSFSMSVPKNWYWQVTTSANSTSVSIWWTPIGTGGCVKQ